MNLAVSLVGAVIGLLAAIGIFAPFRAVRWIRDWHPPSRFWLAVLWRLVLGVFLIRAAPECRTPRLVLALGGLALAAGIAILVMGPRRLDALVDWWLDRSAAVLAVSFAAAAALGCFLVYAGW
jgi:hypothetical protein